MELDAGTYFGEKGIIENAPRAATVSAKTSATVVSLDKLAFNELLYKGHKATRERSYAGAAAGYPTEDEIIGVISAIQDPSSAGPSKQSPGKTVDATKMTGTEDVIRRTTLAAAANIGASDSAVLDLDAAFDGEAPEDSDSELSSGWTTDSEDVDPETHAGLLRWRDDGSQDVMSAGLDLDAKLKNARRSARKRGVGLLDDGRGELVRRRGKEALARARRSIAEHDDDQTVGSGDENTYPHPARTFCFFGRRRGMIRVAAAASPPPRNDPRPRRGVAASVE